MASYQLVGLAIDAEEFLAGFQFPLSALLEDDACGVIVADNAVGIFRHFGVLHVYY